MPQASSTVAGKTAKKTRISWRLLLVFLPLLLLGATLFLFAFPQLEEQYTQQRDHQIQLATNIESSYFSRFIEDRVTILKELAAQPVILNAAMLSDSNSFELVGLLENYSIIGDSTKILIQDLSGGIIYQASQSKLTSDYWQKSWAQNILSKKIPAHFQLLEQEGNNFSFLIAIPLLYGDYVEGTLIAEITTPVDKLFHRTNQENFQFTLSQNDVTINLVRSSIESPHSVSKLIKPYGVTLTYSASQAKELEFRSNVKNVGLTTLLAALLCSLVISVYIGRNNTTSAQPAVQKSTSHRNPTLYLLPLLILLFGIGASYVTFTIIVDLDTAKKRQAVLSQAKSQAEKIETDIIGKTEILRALKAYYDSSQHVTLEEFTSFTKLLLQSNTSIQALGWNPKVAHKQRKLYENNARQQGYDGFLFREKINGVMTTAQTRDFYYPAYYIAPLKGNEPALGFDLGSNPARFAALNQAKKTGEIIATQRITLVQAEKQQAGILVVAPIYSKEPALTNLTNTITGYVLMVLRVGDIINASLQSTNRPIGMSIKDINNSAAENTIYQSDSFSGEAEPIYTHDINVGGRHWLVSLSETNLLARQISEAAKLAMALGVAFSVLAAFYIFQISRRSEQVEHVVEQRTEELRELTSSMENAVEGVSRLNALGHYTYVNEAYARICGYQPEELLDKEWQVTAQEDSLEALNRAYQTMRDTGRISTDTVGIKKDGHLFHKHITMVSRYDKNGEFIGHYCFMSDISLRKEAEEKLVRSNIELSRFAYIASHDLQEPLRMISNFTALLTDEYASIFDETAQQYFRFISEGSQRMRLLVDDLLAYTQIDQDVETFSLTDCQRECRIVLNNMQDTINESNASITVDELPTVYASPIRINRLLQNLIGNALKYCDPNRKPIIHISCKEQQNNWLFAITDNGIGMKEEYFEQIFVMFKRLHTKRSYQGSGIGLAICQKILETLGGDIWVESQLDKGSTFYFTLPKNDSKQNSPMTESPPHEQL